MAVLIYRETTMKGFINKSVPLIALLFLGPIPAYAQDREKSVVEQIVEVQHQLFNGPRPGLRSNHTKGIVAQGEFIPAESASDVSAALHLQQESFPMFIRFSNATGFPDIADNDPRTAAKGLAMRIDLGEEGYTDMVLSSVPRFPVATPEKMLEMFSAIRDSANVETSPKPIETFLANHPAAKAFVEYPKPFSTSFATLAYHGINAFKFTNAAGDSVYGRYLVTPAAGIEHLDKETAAAQDKDYLMNELPQRLVSGPVEFSLAIQVAQQGDEVNDGTVIWPEDRPVVQLGTIRITQMHEDAEAFEKATMFNPLALPEGIEPSDDPILMARPGAYAVSFQHRMD